VATPAAKSVSNRREKKRLKKERRREERERRNSVMHADECRAAMPAVYHDVRLQGRTCKQGQYRRRVLEMSSPNGKRVRVITQVRD
jgi:hypothetical protein